MDDSRDEKIERLLKCAMAGLPLRRAPGSLQRGVLDELALRSAEPWWRRSFAQWPMAARAGFVVVCVMLMSLSLSNGLTQQLGVQTQLWVQPALGLMTSMDAVASLTVALVPPFYLYGALIGGAALYALLFGLGAVAYRMLYLQRSPAAMNGS